MEKKGFATIIAFIVLGIVISVGLTYTAVFSGKAISKGASGAGGEGGSGGEGDSGGGGLIGGDGLLEEVKDTEIIIGGDGGIIREEILCFSEVECSDWSECENGEQRRECEYLDECEVPTRVPKTSRACGVECIPDWECEWSLCNEEGVTAPTCVDNNHCGIEEDIPGKLECDVVEDLCLPDVECGEWSSCGVDYSFSDLEGESLEGLRGVRTRTCSDLNSCVRPLKEISPCSIDVEIYTEPLMKCNKEFIGIYDEYDGELVARVETGTEDKNIFNLYLDDGGESIYCDYCFNGVLDGDEEEIDCGGSCKSCGVGSVIATSNFIVEERNFDKFLDFLNFRS